MVVEEIQNIRGEFPVLALLNCADPKSSAENTEARDALGDFPLMSAMKSQLGRRKSYALAATQGLSVLEYKDKSGKKDSKAIAEVKALMKEIFKGENK